MRYNFKRVQGSDSFEMDINIITKSCLANLLALYNNLSSLMTLENNSIIW